MKISEIQNAQIEEFCGLDENDLNIEIYKASALAFLKGYTGLTDTEIDEHDDLSLAYMVLINDMSFNRDYTVNRDTLNPCVQTILSLYSKNNIG